MVSAYYHELNGEEPVAAFSMGEKEVNNKLWVHCPHNLKSIYPKILEIEKWGQ
jgi:hypothetical protein